MNNKLLKQSSSTFVRVRNKEKYNEQKIWRKNQYDILVQTGQGKI